MPKIAEHYDINIVKKMRNHAQAKGERVSIREIARVNKWDEVATQAWIHRHFIEVTDYIPKDQKMHDNKPVVVASLPGFSTGKQLPPGKFLELPSV